MTKPKPKPARPATTEEAELAAMAAEAGVPELEPITLTQDLAGIRTLAAAMRQALPSGATGRQEEWEQIAARTLGAVAGFQQAARDRAAAEREERNDDGTDDESA